MNNKELIRVLVDMGSSYNYRIDNDPEIQRILKKVDKGVADYADMNKLSVAVGENLSKTLKASITPDAFPTISKEEADGTVLRMLMQAHDTIKEPTAKMQKQLNEKAGVGLNPVEPEFDMDRASGLCEKLASYEKLEDGLWVLEEPVINFSQNIVDEFVSKNASAQFDAGMHPKIIRKPDSGACKWCLALAGEYDYPDKTPKDVFRRHERCRCTVEYVPGKGKGRQDVWTKKWKAQQADESKTRVDRIERVPAAGAKNPAEVERQAAFNSWRPGKTDYDKMSANDVLDNSLSGAYERHRIENNLRSTAYADFGDLIETPVGANLDGLKETTKRNVTETVSTLIRQYDTTLSKVEVMPEEERLFHRNAFAFVRHNYETDTSVLYLNPKKIGETARVRELADKGYCAKISAGTEAQYVPTHEFAHTLISTGDELSDARNWVDADYKKVRRVRKELTDMYDEYIKECGTIEAQAKDAEMQFMMGDANAADRARLLYEELDAVRISKYSMTNADEFMAEAFAESKLGTPGKWSTRVMEVIEREYGVN